MFSCIENRKEYKIYQSVCKSIILFRIFDISDLSSKEIKIPLEIIKSAIADTECNKNEIFVIVDLQHAEGFHFKFLFPIVSWIKSSRELFKKKLNYTHIVIKEESIWLSIFNKLMLMVKTARPTKITDLKNTPEFILSILDRTLQSIQ